MYIFLGMPKCGVTVNIKRIKMSSPLYSYNASQF